MVSFAPTSPETLEDQRLYTQARMVEVACQDCLARVKVKKNSEHHTAVQWTGEALSQCQEFARMNQSPKGRPVHETCPRLMASIDRAVAEGELEVGAVDGCCPMLLYAQAVPLQILDAVSIGIWGIHRYVPAQDHYIIVLSKEGGKGLTDEAGAAGNDDLFIFHDLLV